MVPNILSSDLPMSLPPSVGLNSTFLEHGHVAYQIKGNHEFSNMVANNLHADPPPPTPTRTLWYGVKISKFNFFRTEHCHVAYQIKGNHECNNIVTNSLPADPPTLGMGSVGQISTFSEHGHVAYQIKWNHELQQHGTKYFARRPPNAPDLASRSKFQLFLEHVHDAYQI